MEPATAAANPAAGWFTDPHAPNFLRWWDGIQWTHHVHPVPGAAPSHQVAAQPPHHVAQHAAHHAAAQANPAYSAGSGLAHAGATAYPAAAYAPAAAETQPFAAQATTGSESLYDANPRSVTAIGVSLLYLLIAITTGFVFAGIVPALYTFRAFERREKLAPAALLAAVVAIGFAVTHWQTRT